MRTYESTHPWLQFSIDLAKAPPSLWVMLGECQSKCGHVANTLLQPERAKRMHSVYLAKGALATNAIEGNTLTEEQVQQHLEGKLRLPRSQEYLKQEVQNVISECNRILDKLRSRDLPEISVDEVREMNKAVLNGLKLDEDIVPGEIRTYDVGVARYKGAPPEDCQYLLERLCSWLNSEEFRGREEMKTIDAVLRAVLAHLYLAWIHPFGDGNGRTARLVEFQILISSGVPAPAAHLLSNHYNKTRSEYYRQLDRSSRSRGDELSFIHYAVEGFRDGLQMQLEEIHKQQIDVVWRDYVHERFEGEKSPTKERRMRLVFGLSARDDLSGWPGWVRLDEVQTLTSQLANDYSGRLKTLSRDVNALFEMGLVDKRKRDVRARKENISAFLPITVGS